MALTRISNQSLTSVTALPSGMTSAPGLTTGKVINYYSNVNICFHLHFL